MAHTHSIYIYWYNNGIFVTYVYVTSDKKKRNTCVQWYVDDIVRNFRWWKMKLAPSWYAYYDRHDEIDESEMKSSLLLVFACMAMMFAKLALITYWMLFGKRPGKKFLGSFLMTMFFSKFSEGWKFERDAINLSELYSCRNYGIYDLTNSNIININTKIGVFQCMNE